MVHKKHKTERKKHKKEFSDLRLAPFMFCFVLLVFCPRFVRLENLLRFAEISPVGTREARQAFGFPTNELEDALQSAAAFSFDADYIVSRNLSR